MRTVLRRVERALIQFFGEPTEDQIRSELRMAFGLKSNVEYSVKNNHVVVSGDVDAAPSFYVDSQGMLHVVCGDDEFVVRDNSLYVVE